MLSLLVQCNMASLARSSCLEGTARLCRNEKWSARRRHALQNCCLRGRTYFRIGSRLSARLCVERGATSCGFDEWRSRATFAKCCLATNSCSCFRDKRKKRRVDKALQSSLHPKPRKGGAHVVKWVPVRDSLHHYFFGIGIHFCRFQAWD